MDREPEIELEVARLREAADDVLELTLRRHDGGDLPPWSPGAHVDLVLTPNLIRQYSLCGSCDDRSTYRLGVLREQAGRGGSAYVHDALTVGDRVGVRGPRNHFALADATRYQFIAGGIGITPILPMMARAQVRGASWSLLYGGRTRGSMAFVDELVPYADRVRICPQDEYGLLDLGSVLDPPRSDTLVYCCGPEPLLTAVTEAMTSWPHGALHVERFAPKPEALHPPSAADTAFDVVLAHAGITVRVQPGQSIVQALAGAGIEVPTSCTEGVCGTCETAVLAGVPDHRDSLLTDDERAANDTMLLCVSRCKGATLTLAL